MISKKNKSLQSYSLFLSLFLVVFSCGLNAQEDGMERVEAGIYTPLYGTDSTAVSVTAFKIDKFPVTNQQFLAFVRKNPKWQKSNVKGLFAEKRYLNHWKNDLELSNSSLDKTPVTNVSWFAAKKYCECQGKRLPTLDEWEYVAMADKTSPDAREKEGYNAFILGWYEKPKSFNDEVGSTFKNYWGVYDMHGLVWEWTNDFNSVIISGETRRDENNSNNNLFCGSAAIGSSDLMNYAAFMRYAFRSSIKANYTIKNLGFRCAEDIETQKNDKHETL